MTAVSTLVDDPFIHLLEAAAEELLHEAQTVASALRGSSHQQSQAALSAILPSLEKICECLPVTLATGWEREDVSNGVKGFERAHRALIILHHRLRALEPNLHSIDLRPLASGLEKAVNLLNNLVKRLRYPYELHPPRDLLEQLQGVCEQIQESALHHLVVQPSDSLSVLAQRDVLEAFDKVLESCEEAGHTVFQLLLKVN